MTKHFGIYDYSVNEKMVKLSKGKFKIADDNELIADDTVNLTEKFAKYFRLWYDLYKVKKFTDANESVDSYQIGETNYIRVKDLIAMGIIGGLKKQTLINRFGTEFVDAAIGKPLDPIKANMNHNNRKALERCSKEFHELRFKKIQSSDWKFNQEMIRILKDELKKPENLNNKELQQKLNDLVDQINADTELDKQHYLDEIKKYPRIND